MQTERRGQRYSCGMHYTLLAEAAGIPLADLFFNADAIVSAYRRAQGDLFSPALRAALKDDLDRPVPAGLGYGHVAALGVPIETPSEGEPHPVPILHDPQDVARLTEPASFIDAPFVRARIDLAEEVARKWDGSAPLGPNLGAQGPVTSGVLLAGLDFLTWPRSDPEAAHALLAFCARSAPAYLRAISAYYGGTWPPARWCLTDDFAGMLSPAAFDEFVVPSWDAYYREIGCTTRVLHSELLRPAHLSRLSSLGIEEFDPSADQYLTAELLEAHCPVPYQLRILDWHIRDLTVPELCAMYRRYEGFHPTTIQFAIERLAEEEKYLALLELARELANEGPRDQ